MLYFCRFLCMSLFLLFFMATAIEKDNPFTSVVRESLLNTARTCMDKTNTSEADLEYLRNDPPYPEKTACIIKCLLEKIGIVKNNKYFKPGFVTAVTPLVFKNKKKLEHMKSVSEKCEKEVKHSGATSCELGNEIVTCIYKYAPELHMKA
ncbi:uncharacterized protein LOC128678648 [Plodia interpunctella]|uniref:uncharacterized protein LOC128678648 n=1 Tax=Plodia interpunctella TaxID=58824 RepID=UPI002367BE87|nr:uncharacterized protein LOC128678648 [Plodia interpunctella]